MTYDELLMGMFLEDEQLVPVRPLMITNYRMCDAETVGWPVEDEKFGLRLFLTNKRIFFLDADLEEITRLERVKVGPPSLAARRNRRPPTTARSPSFRVSALPKPTDGNTCCCGVCAWFGLVGLQEKGDVFLVDRLSVDLMVVDELFYFPVILSAHYHHWHIWKWKTWKWHGVWSEFVEMMTNVFIDPRWALTHGTSVQTPPSPLHTQTS